MNIRFMLPQLYRGLENQFNLVYLNRTEIEKKSPQTLILDESYDSCIIGFDLNTSAVVYDSHLLIDEKWSYEDADTYNLDQFSDEWAIAYDEQFDILNDDQKGLLKEDDADIIPPIFTINTLIF